MESVYNYTHKIGEEKLNEGFDYSEVLINKTVSNYLLRNNNLKDFLSKIAKILFNNIESVKKIRIHNNFTVKPDTTYIN